MKTKSKHIAIIFAALAAIAIASGCTPALAEQPTATPRVEFRDISDYFAPRDPEGAARVAREQAEKAAESQQEAAGATETAEAEYVAEYDDGAAYSGSHGFHGNPDGLNSFDGVNEFGGRRETFYSGDNAAYRDSLWVDEDGFYRTESGNYAVAASDMPQGATFEGSQGTCEVVDTGCDAGVTDYCVSGWY